MMHRNSQTLRLVSRGALGAHGNERPLPLRRALQRELRPLAGPCQKVVAWLLPMVDPVFGPGWRCTLHAFTREGELVPVSVTGFDAGSTAREAVDRLMDAVETRTGQPVRPVVTTAPAVAAAEAPVEASPAPAVEPGPASSDGKPRRPRRRAA